MEPTPLADAATYDVWLLIKSRRLLRRMRTMCGLGRTAASRPDETHLRTVEG